MRAPFLPLGPNTSVCRVCLAQARLRAQRNPGPVAYPLPCALPTNLAFPAHQRFRSLKSPPALPPKRMSAVRFVFSEHSRTGPNKGSSPDPCSGSQNLTPFLFRSIPITLCIFILLAHKILPEFNHANRFRSSRRYCTASARWVTVTEGAASRSAMVRETRRILS